MNIAPAVPSTAVDIYADSEILDPYVTYAALRDAGPVVHMPVHDLYAVSRHADVHKAALDHRTFSSASGVAANSLVNGLRTDSDTRTTIASNSKLTSRRASPSSAREGDRLKKRHGDAVAKIERLVETVANGAEDHRNP